MTGSGRAERVRVWVERVEQAALGALLTAMVFLAALQIILRNFFGLGIHWTEPFLGSAMLWLTLLGALAATGRHKHITIDLLPHLVPPRVRLAFGIFTDAVSAAVCGVLCGAAVRFVQIQREFGDVAFLGVPQWVVQLVLPVGFGLMALRFAVHVVWAFRPSAWRRPHGGAVKAGGGAP